MAELVTIAYYYDFSDAFVAKSLLEGHGFNVSLFGEYLGSSWAFLGTENPMRLVVPDTEAEDALELLGSTLSPNSD